MPFNSNEELPKGTQGLPEGQKTKWRKVFNAAYEGTCKDKGKDRDSCASKIAWSQIEDKYKGKALVQFSMAITHATQNKSEGTYRWKAVASDTDTDAYGDNMTMELFNDFIHRIEIKEVAPEEFRSSFWQGGLPYLSISHYPDLEGKAVPGVVDTVFIDGKQLRSYGQFNQTPLGLACYNSVCQDLYKEPKPENPVRISIAFLDYGHIHKSNGYEFIRKNIDEICPECLKETFNGEGEGLIFKRGLLVQEALTRVPVNERTSMEVDRSMTTRKEDAESIVGELVEEIEEEAQLVGKSKALVIKSEEETPVAVELIEEGKSDKATEDVKCPDGMSEEDCKKHQEEMKKPKKSAVDKRMDHIEQMLSQLLEQKPVETAPVEVPAHVLDTAFSTFKSHYDEIQSLDVASDDKLHQLQEPFNVFASTVIKSMKVEEDEVETKPDATSDLVKALSSAITLAMQPTNDKLDLLLTQSSQVVKSTTTTPVRRSMAPNLSQQVGVNPLAPAAPKPVTSGSPTPELDAIIRKTVFGK